MHTNVRYAPWIGLEMFEDALTVLLFLVVYTVYTDFLWKMTETLSYIRYLNVVLVQFYLFKSCIAPTSKSDTFLLNYMYRPMS